MNKISLLLALVLAAATPSVFPAVVINESPTPIQFSSSTLGDHSRLYQVITADVGDWPGWYINSLSVKGFASNSSSFNPSASSFTLRFYDSSGVQIGSEYTNTSASALAPKDPYNRYFFTVNFDLPDDTIIVQDNSSFYYSVASADGLNMNNANATSNFGNGWGTGIAWAGSVGGVYLGANTTGLTVDAVMVPEPSALSLLAAGLGVLAVMRRRRA